MRFKENEEAPTGQLIQTKGKFNDMYADLTTKLADLEEELLTEQEKTAEAVERERLAQERLGALHKTGSKAKEVSETTLFESKNKLNQAVKAREDIAEKYNRLADQLAVVGRENARWRKTFLEKDVTNQIEQQLFDAETDRIRQEIAAKEQVVADLQLRKEENQAILDGDLKLAEMRKKQTELVEALAAKEMELETMAYKFLETDALHKLAIKQLDFEAEERRKLGEEVTRLRALLEETERSIGLKMQRQTREYIPKDLNVAEDRLAKSQLELQDLQTRFASAHQFHTRYSLEIAGLKARKEANVAEQTQVAGRIKEIEETIQREEAVLAQRLQTLEATQKRRKELEQRKTAALTIFEDKQSQAEGLKARLRFLEAKFDFSDLMRQVDVEQLRQVVSSNNSVNRTISDVLQNWEAMKGLGSQK